jgi:phosphoribosylanthranilate isomerase
MKPFKIKVCGMKFDENILEISKLQTTHLQIDMLGFIFYEKSKRYVGEDFLMPPLPKNVQKVGVFVDATENYILEKTQKYNLDYIQLHGNETSEFCKNLRNKIPKVKIIKAFGVKNDFNFDKLEEYENYTDFYLFDTKGNEYGGNGISFDWSILDKYNYKKPTFLSGGLGLENQQELVSFLKQTHLPIFALDLNSRFEISPAFKDNDLLNKFMIGFEENLDF